MNYQMIGGLMVQLAADVASLKKDMDEAEKVVGKGAVAMQKGAELVKGAFVGLAGALSVAAVYGWVKAAADAGDEMKAFSQKTGVAVQDVAGLQLAFKQGGVESGALQGAIAKMSRQMADGSKAFKEMGIETRNADGSMRSAKDVLYDVADATKEAGASLQTSAALQQLFGKSAASLVPVLVEGADGLRQMDEMARKLGLTMDSETADAADKFNDTMELLGLGLTGVGRQVAAQLLPTLGSLAESFLTTMTEGDRLKRISDGLSTGLKVLYTAVLGVIEVFSTFGKLIGGTVAKLMAEISGLGEAIVKVFAGDFKGAAEAAQNGFKQSAQISREMSADIKQGWQSTGKAISTAWDETSGKTVAAMAEMDKKGKQLTFTTKEQEEAAKKAADAEAKRLTEVKKLTEGLDKQIQTMALQEEQGVKLTKAQEQELDLNLKLQNGTLKLTEAEEREVRAKLEQVKAGEKRAEELAKEKKWMDETAKSNDAFTATLEKQTQQIQAEVEKLRESNAMLELNKDQVAALEIAKLEEAAATAQQRAEWAEENMLGEDIVQQYKDQASGLRELAKLKGEKVHLEAAVEARDAWKQTTDEIGKSFTDSLFRAFEEGKSFSEAFMGSLKNLFKTTVLKLLIQPVQAGMNNMIGSMFGMGGGGGAGAGGIFGGLGNMLSSAGSWMGEGSTAGGWLNSAGSFLSGGAGTGLSGMLGNFGAGWGVGTQAAGQGIASWWNMGTGMMEAGATQGGLGALAGGAATSLGGFMAGRGLGQMISGGYGSNAAVNIGSAIGTALGGPLGSAIGGAIGGLVNRAFGRGPKETQESGIQGSIGASGVSNGQTYSNWLQKGGWFRSDKRGTDYRAMGSDISQMMGAGAKAILTQTQEWARVLKLPAEQLASVTTGFKVKLGSDEKENTAAITKVFENYQRDLSDSFSSILKPFQKAGESLSDTLSRLSVIQQFSEGINQFGGVFSKVASLSISAKEELMGFAGGMEAFVAKTRSYVDSYYTEQEKVGLAAKQFKDAFSALGLGDAGALGSKADFRKLVEGVDVSTSDGRKMLNQLLDLAPAFAQIGDYLEKNNQTLAEAVAQAPTVELLQNVLDDKEVQERYHNQLVDRLQALDSSVVDAGKMTNAALERLIASNETRFASLEAAMRYGWKFLEDAWMAERP